MLALLMALSTVQSLSDPPAAVSPDSVPSASEPLVAAPLSADPAERGTSGRSCAGSANVDDIRILPPGPVVLPADQVLELNATLFDVDDNVIAGPPTWGADGGSLQVMDSNIARYSPNTLGRQFVWACVGPVNQSVEVNVVIGEVVELRLRVDESNVSADDVVELNLYRVDAPGNEQAAYVLNTANWTYPVDSSLELPIGGPARWTPGSTGQQTISVADGGFVAEVTLNVSQGVATSLVIDGWTSGDQLSADDSLSLQMAVADQRGNLLPVNGSWDILGSGGDDQLQAAEGSNVTFVAGTAQAWVVEARYDGNESGGFELVGTTSIIVVPGRLAWLSLPGHGTNVRIGEPFDLQPTGQDADGNNVSLTGLGWNVTGPSGLQAIDQVNLTFSPTSTGQHVVLVDSGSRVAQIALEVVHGLPESLTIEADDGGGLSVVTGEAILFTVRGEDAYGNVYPVDVDWTVPSGFGNMTPGTGGVGVYEYSASGTGYVSMTATIQNRTWTEIFHVLPGEPAEIRIELTGDAVQGSSMVVDISVYDEAGNPAVFGACSIVVTSTAGPASCSAGIWTIQLENGGEQQRVEARLDDAYGRVYFDVESVLLGGQFGSNQTVMLLGGILIAVLICGVLLAAYWKSGMMLRNTDPEDEDDESGEPSPAVAMVDGPPPPMPVLAEVESAQQAGVGRPLSIPAMLGRGMPIPPPAHVFRTTGGTAPPMPLGLITAAPPAQPAGYAAVSQTTLATSPAAAWMSTLDPSYLQPAAPAPSAPTTSLSSALDAFAAPSEPVPEARTESEEHAEAVPAAIEPEPVLPGPAEPEPEMTAEPEVQVEPPAEPAAESESGGSGPADPAESGPKASVEPPAESEPEVAVESAVESPVQTPEESQAEPPIEPPGDPWALEWYEPGMVLPRDHGPRTDIQPMRALPGTRPGDDGWYFDENERPAHWQHDEENGWVRS